ncbi:MAG TPA: hypothetical protein VM778_01275 [Gemmatimonadota bacterium]|nr:hypothetical protein [Gemmatimonadota bacterium]
MIRSIGVTTIALALWAAPVVAQDAEVIGDTTTVEETEEAVEEATDETADVADETADVAEDAADVAEDAAETAEEPIETHDWEYALSATDRAPGARGEVRVTEGEPANTFVLEVSALPAVDELDEPNRDVNAYTVWIVPSKDRVPESTLGGVLNVDPETGQGTFNGTTSLDTFGVIVSATADGAPARIGGIPVLTGIPVSPEPAAEPEAPAAETPVEESEMPAPEMETPTEEPPAEDAGTPPTPEAPGGAEG